MTQPLTSVVNYPGDGIVDTFTVPFAFVSRTDVKVRLDTTEQVVDTDWTWITDSSIQMTSVPADGSLLKIWRETEISSRLVDFQDGSVLREADLDLANKQIFYLAQEIADGYLYPLEQALITLANNNGIVVTDSESAIAELVQAVLTDETAAEVADALADIAANAAAIVAQGAEIDLVEADIVSLEATDGTHSSDITSLQGVNANQAIDITTLQSSVGDAEANITTLFSTTATQTGDITTLEARYGVVLDVNDHITGFTQFNDGITGSFNIVADEFKIVDPDNGLGVPQTVFSVSGGVTAMQNVTINGNLVVNGTITSDELTGAQLSDLYSDMGAITAGTITLDTAGHIKGGQTAYDTGTGFFLGYSTDAYKFSIGDGGVTDFMTWDGTTLRVSGSIVIGTYTASTSEMLLEANTERTATDPDSYVELKKFEINKPGTVRVYVDGKLASIVGGVHQAGSVRVLLDGVLKDTFSFSTTSYVEANTTITTTTSSQYITLEVRAGERDTAEPVTTNCLIQDASVRATTSLGEAVITD